MRGVNPKRWFYQFNDFLAARPEQTARVLCGPSAERWLAAEMYGYLPSLVVAPVTAATCRVAEQTTSVLGDATSAASAMARVRTAHAQRPIIALPAFSAL